MAPTRLTQSTHQRAPHSDPNLQWAPQHSEGHNVATARAPGHSHSVAPRTLRHHPRNYPVTPTQEARTDQSATCPYDTPKKAGARRRHNEIAPGLYRRCGPGTVARTKGADICGRIKGCHQMLWPKAAGIDGCWWICSTNRREVNGGGVLRSQQTE